MDSHNLFMTPVTARLIRLEYAVAVAVCAVLVLLHWHDIRWAVFVGMFAVIDLVGYIPGRIVWQRRHGGDVPKQFYVLYNVMHSMVTSAVIAGAWCLFVGPEWALLALPIHLCGDRALFGNFLKPFGLAFEPKTDPAYAEFRSSYAGTVDADAAAGRTLAAPFAEAA